MKTNQTYCNLHNVALNTRGISRSDVPLEGWIVKYLVFHPLSISNDECGEKSSPLALLLCQRHGVATRLLSRYRRACHSESRFLGQMPKASLRENLAFSCRFKGKILRCAENDIERRIFQRFFVKALGEGSEVKSDSSLSHSSGGIAQNDILINQ